MYCIGLQAIGPFDGFFSAECGSSYEINSATVYILKEAKTAFTLPRVILLLTNRTLENRKRLVRRTAKRYAMIIAFAVCACGRKERAIRRLLIAAPNDSYTNVSASSSREEKFPKSARLSAYMTTLYFV